MAAGIAPRVLVVDADVDRRRAIGNMLARLGVGYEEVSSLEAAADRARDGVPRVILTDAELIVVAASAGAGLLDRIPGPVLLVGILRGSSLSAAAVLTAGADSTLREPVGIADLERVLVLARVIQPESDNVHRQRFRRMSALRQLALDAIDLIGPEERLEPVLDIGQKVLGATALAMYDLVEGEDRFRCAGAVGLSEEYIRHVEERSRHHARAVFTSIIQDHYPLLRLTGEMPDSRLRIDPAVARRANLSVVVPLTVRSSTQDFGLLAVYYADENAYDPADLALADAFAAILAAALERVRLERELVEAEALYRELVSSLPIGTVVCGLDGRIEIVNPVVSALSGRRPDELVGTRFVDLFFNPDAVSWDVWERKTDELVEPIILHMRGAGGRRLIVRCRGRRIDTPSATAGRLQVTIEDITIQHRRLHELQLLHDLTQLISMKGDTEVAFRTVAERMVGDIGYRIVGLALLTSDGRHFEGGAYHAHQRSRGGPLQRWSIETGITGRAIRENRSILVRDVHADPDYLPVDHEVTSELVVVIRAGDEPVGVLDIESDATLPLGEDDLALAESIAVHLGVLLDQREFTRRLQLQARTDPVTGIPNRRVLVERLQSLAGSRRVRSAALLLIDLDKFKQINDQHGHLAGDEVIQQVVNRLARNLRPDDLLARYAGDELAVVLTNVTPSRAHQVAERLCRAVSSAPFEYGGISTDLTVSIGIALYPLQGATPEELLTVADRAMYVVKTQGGNAVSGEFRDP